MTRLSLAPLASSPGPVLGSWGRTRDHAAIVRGGRVGKLRSPRAPQPVPERAHRTFSIAAAATSSSRRRAPRSARSVAGSASTTRPCSAGSRRAGPATRPVAGTSSAARSRRPGWAVRSSRRSEPATTRATSAGPGSSSSATGTRPSSIRPWRSSRSRSRSACYRRPALRSPPRARPSREEPSMTKPKVEPWIADEIRRDIDDAAQRKDPVSLRSFGAEAQASGLPDQASRAFESASLIESWLAKNKPSRVAQDQVRGRGPATHASRVDPPVRRAGVERRPAVRPDRVAGPRTPAGHRAEPPTRRAPARSQAHTSGRAAGEAVVALDPFRNPVTDRWAMRPDMWRA